MSEMKEILDKLLCPVCLAHPEQEVFQCLNGHPICSICIQRLRVCPQCQIPFGVSHLRCLVFESFLDIVQLPCSNKDAGCTLCFPRKELLDHHKTCEFRSVSLCKWMGFECNFSASKVEPLIKHLESCHNARRLNKVFFNKFERKCNGPAALFRSICIKECAGDPDSQSSNKTWFLVLVTLTDAPNGQKLFSCVPIYLIDGHSTAESKVSLSLRIKNEQRTKERQLYKWIGIPANYKDAEEYILHSPLRLTTNYIMQQALKLTTSEVSQFDLSLKISVVKHIPVGQEVQQDDANESQ